MTVAPGKPDKQRDQISMLWDAVYNHIPTQLHWQNTKVNFVLAMLGLLIGLTALSLSLTIIRG